jgi:hypothetical protein
MIEHRFLLSSLEQDYDNIFEWICENDVNWTYKVLAGGVAVFLQFPTSELVTMFKLKFVL